MIKLERSGIKVDFKFNISVQIQHLLTYLINQEHVFHKWMHELYFPQNIWKAEVLKLIGQKDKTHSASF